MLKSYCSILKSFLEPKSYLFHNFSGSIETGTYHARFSLYSITSYLSKTLYELKIIKYFYVYFIENQTVVPFSSVLIENLCLFRSVYFYISFVRISLLSSKVCRIKFPRLLKHILMLKILVFEKFFHF